MDLGGTLLAFVPRGSGHKSASILRAGQGRVLHISHCIAVPGRLCSIMLSCAIGRKDDQPAGQPVLQEMSTADGHTEVYVGSIAPILSLLCLHILAILPEA